MKKALLVLPVAAVLAGGFFLLSRSRPDHIEANSLSVYCAAGLKQPVEEIASAYQKEFGTAIHLQYGGTGTLLTDLRVSGKGDLFIAADASSIENARRLDLVRENLPIVRQHPVIAVKAGNPKKIATLEDLFRDDVKTAVANPEAASIGRSTKEALGGKWEALAAHVAVMKPTVTALAADLTVGAVDAAIIWDATVPQFKGLEAVEVPELAEKVETASAAVLASCKQSAAALKFARYLSAPEKGGAVFTRHGFEAAGGDKWAETPELILYSGGVNRPAVEKLLTEFSAREGATLTTVFNGCGVLCATMKTMPSAEDPKFPDAYYACDLCFIPPVAEFFPTAVLLTETDIGIAVPKGNPANIKTLFDLARPGLKIGLCNARQSTLGYMTQGMLKSSGLITSVGKNTAVEVPTADFLINQLQAGALDAAVVYRVNTLLREDKLDFIAINHAGARAVQPFAIRETSEKRNLAGRLLAFLQQNRETFEKSGFQWIEDQTPVKSAEIEIPSWLKSGQ